MGELATTLGGYYAALMMTVAWFATEYIWDPVAHWVVMHRVLTRARKQLSFLKKFSKWVASAVWIYPMALWIPGAQPPLCDPPSIDLGAQCHTLFEHWAIPGILAGILSGGHFTAKITKLLFNKIVKKDSGGKG